MAERFLSRIRTIKPEFPQSEDVGRLSRDARLLFIQLWTLVDDDGRTRAASRMLASLLYPYDDDAPKLLDKWLAELEAEELVRVYEVNSSRYLEVVNWRKHQRIDKPTPSRLPSFLEASETISDHPDSPREESKTDLGPSTLDLGKDQVSSSDANAPRRSDDDWFEEFWGVYPKRNGTNSQKQAREKFKKLLKRGVDPAEIIAGNEGLCSGNGRQGWHRIYQAGHFVFERRTLGRLPFQSTYSNDWASKTARAWNANR